MNKNKAHVCLLITIFACCLFTLPIKAFEGSSLEVTVKDEQDAIIQKAAVRIISDQGTAKVALLTLRGTYTIDEVPPGNYKLEISAEGFEPIGQNIIIESGRNEVVIRMHVKTLQENVEIEQNQQDKAIDPYDGAFSNFLTRDQIDALPEDPEALAQALRNQFGRDVIIKIDGFAGKLPPKSQIASIRVTRSSFDAEHHEIGSTFVDIISKAAGGRWFGTTNFDFNDEHLNARNPFAEARFPSQKHEFGLFLTGPIIKDRTSATVIFSGQKSFESKNVYAALPNKIVRNSIEKPISSLFSLLKIKQNLARGATLNLDYSFAFRASKNEGIGGIDLPERGFASGNSTNTLRAYESGFIGKRFLNEIRFQFIKEESSLTPISDKPAILVIDSFNSGGSGNQRESKRNFYEISDNFLFGIGKILSLKMGGISSFESRKTESKTNNNGSFVFSSLNEYVEGRPATFTQAPGARLSDVSQLRFGSFIQNDIRINKSLLFSAGLRYEIQNNLDDRNNFAPRLGFSWSPFTSGTLTFRGGGGFFYEWLDTNLLSMVRSNGDSQVSETIILNPSYPLQGTTSNSQNLGSSYWQLDKRIRNPYVFVSSLGVETHVSKKLSFRALYTYKKGVHQFRTREINAPIGGVRPNPSIGRILQVESSASFNQSILEFETNGRLSKNLTFTGNYTFGRKMSDTAGIYGFPSNSYNLRKDYSFADDDLRHHFYSAFYLQIIKDLSFSTILIVDSPTPYNITTGFDNNSDTIFNDRPYDVARNSKRGSWQKQVNASMGWTIGLISEKGKHGAKRAVIMDDSGLVSNQDFRFSLRFTITATNVFNFTNLADYVGTETSPFFMKPTIARAPRKIELGIRFTF